MKVLNFLLLISLLASLINFFSGAKLKLNGKWIETKTEECKGQWKYQTMEYFGCGKCDDFGVLGKRKWCAVVSEKDTLYDQEILDSNYFKKVPWKWCGDC